MRHMNEIELENLLDYIKGRIGFKEYIVPGLNTYPDRDEVHNFIHRSCIVLEERGLVQRINDKPNHVRWMATKGGNPR